MNLHQDLPNLAALTINKNSEGWGPSDIPDEFKNMPYQPFSKDTRLGKIADWSGNVYQDIKYKNRYIPQFGGGGQYAYYHDDDDSNFITAGTNKIKQPAYYKNRQRILTQRKQRGALQYNTRQNQYNQQSNVQQNRLRQNIPNFRKGNFRTQDHRNRVVRVIREPSIQIPDHWLAVDEIDLSRATSLSLPNRQKPLDLADFGELGYFDEKLDRVNTKDEVPFTQTKKFNFWYIPLMIDTVIIELIKNKIGNVFLSTQVASFLMCSPRSVYSWDIIAYREDDSILLDFRENIDPVNIDPFTMNETAQEAPDEKLVRAYTYESAVCNNQFRQRVIVTDAKAQKYSFPSLIPDLKEDSEDEEDTKEDDNKKKQFQSFGFRYRLFDIGNGIKIVIRCEVDAVVAGPKKSEKKFACVYALTECPQKAPGAVDWRSKLDTQVGAVLATELKNNSFKLARFTTRAILSGAQFIKLGFISRVNPKESVKHTILGVQQFKTPEFSQQIGYNADNAWGILRCIIEHLFRMPVGTYLIQKDANKPILRFHTIPAQFQNEDITEDMDDEQIKAFREKQKVDAEERLAKINDALGSNKLGTV